MRGTGVCSSLEKSFCRFIATASVDSGYTCSYYLPIWRATPAKQS